MQVEATHPYSTGPLHDLCMEVIKRHEKLMASMSPVVESVNFVRANTSGQEEKIMGTCFSCVRPGHRKQDCNSRQKDQAKGLFLKKKGGDKALLDRPRVLLLRDKEVKTRTGSTRISTRTSTIP